MSMKLSYFGITGLAEPIRMALALSGQEFEDDRLDGAAWGAKKAEPKYASCQMPILELKQPGGAEVMMTQSRAILRYVGTIGAFNGKKLYPDDPLQRFYCDECIELVEDFRNFLTPTFAIQDEEAKKSARVALVTEPDGKLLPGLRKLDARLAQFAYCAGEDPSVADCYVVGICYLFQQPTFLDGFPDDTFKQFPNIVALKNRLCSLEPLAKYYAGAEGIRAPFGSTK